MMTVTEVTQLMTDYGMYVGSFIVDDSLTEDFVASFGSKRSKSKSIENKVYVYSGEGNIPHVHILKDGHPDSCVQILDNKYFIHQGKDRVLNKHERKAFNTLMHSASPNPKNETGVTTWEHVKAIYYVNNIFTCTSDVLKKLQNAKTIPDYTEISIERK